MEKLRCSNCGFEKEILEFEQENYKCMLCNGQMEIIENQNIAGDNTGIDEVINQQLIQRLIMDIKQKGEPLVWDFINKLKLDSRLDYLELFFEAKKIFLDQKLNSSGNENNF